MLGTVAFHVLFNISFPFLGSGGRITVHRAGVRESEFIGYQTAQAS